MNHVSEIARPPDGSDLPWVRRKHRWGTRRARAFGLALAALVLLAGAIWYGSQLVRRGQPERPIVVPAPPAGNAAVPLAQIAAMQAGLAPDKPGATARATALIHALARAELLRAEAGGRQAGRSPDTDPALVRAADALLGDRNADPGEIMDAAGLALSLVDAPSIRTDLALRLAGYEQRHGGRLRDLGESYDQVRDDLRALGPALGDRRLSGFAVLFARDPDQAAAEAALRLAATITDPALRSDTFHAVARAILAAREPAIPDLAVWRQAGAPDAALLAAARRQAAKGRFHAARVFALAAGGSAEPGPARNARDATLAVVARAMSARRRENQALPVALAIAGRPARDHALLFVVGAGLRDRMLHEAQAARAAIGNRGARTVATAMVADALGRRGLVRQVRAMVDGLSSALSALPAGRARDIAASHAASAYAAAGDIDRATAALDLVDLAGPRRSAAARAIAEAVLASGGDPADAAELAARADGRAAGEILGIAAIRIATADPERAIEIVDTAETPAARSRAIARLAGARPMSTDRLGAARNAALELSSAATTPAEKSAAAFDLGMIEAALDATAQAQQRLAQVADVVERRDLAGSIATRLVGADRTAEALELADVLALDDADGIDAVYRAVAIALVERGALRPATRVARRIDDPIRRVRVFRRLAVEQSKRLDRDRALAGETRIVPSDYRAPLKVEPLIRRAQFSIFPLTDDELGNALPRLPDAMRYRAETVAAAVPMIANGRIDIAPLANNGLNKKFLTKRSLFADHQIGSPTIVMTAQATRYPIYIHLGSGVIDLPTLHDELIARGRGDLLIRQGRNYTLRAPLLIGEGATLVLSDADVSALRLSRDRAAYLVNAGSLFMSGVDLIGWDEAAKAPALATYETAHEFRPFYVAWSNSHTYAAASRFANLGYAAGKAYGFSLSSGPTSLAREVREQAEPTGMIVDNSFENLLYGFYSYEARTVAVVGNEYRDNIVYGIDPHDRSHGLLFAFNTAYGTQRKHGIIGSRNVQDGWFLGNLSFANHGSGLMMDRYAGRNILYANTAFDNLGDGISIYESPCNIISTNQVVANGRAGIKVRNSWNVGIHRNDIRLNGAAGVEGYALDLGEDEGGVARDVLTDPYQRALSMSLARNTVAHNRGGALSLTSLGHVALRDNQLVGEPSRLYQGELAAAEQDAVRGQRAGMIIGGACPRPRVQYQCPFLKRRELSAELERAPVGGAGAGSCVVRSRAAPANGVAEDAGDVADIDVARATLGG